MAGSFTSGFNQGLAGGATLQGILQRAEAGDVARYQRRSDEYVRGVMAIDGPDGTGDLSTWSDEQVAALDQLTKDYQDLLGDRPMGKQSFLGLTRVKDPADGRAGLVARINVTNPETGEESGEVPVTRNGTSDPNDPVVIVKSVDDIINPVVKNAQSMLQRAQQLSDGSFQAVQGRLGQGVTQNAYETLNNRFHPSGQGTVEPVAEPAGAAAAAQPQGLAGAQAAAPAARPQGAIATPPQPAPNQQLFADQGAGVTTRTHGIREKNGALTPLKPEQIEKLNLARKYAIERGLNPEMVEFLVLQESSANSQPKANSANALGLTQMTPVAVDQVNQEYGTNYTHAEMADDEKSLEAGTLYLKYLLKKFDGDEEMALAAYNAGETKVRKLGLSAGGEETRGYIANWRKDQQRRAQQPAAQQVSTTEEEEEEEEEEEVGAQVANTAQPAAASAQPSSEFLDTPTIPGNLKITPEMQQKRKDAEIAKVEAQIASYENARGRNKTAAEKRLPQLREELAALKGERAARAEQVTPANDKQREIQKEMEKTPEPQSKEEVEEADKTLQAIKPAKKLNAEERKAIYWLHRSNPQQFTGEWVLKALETGRLTKSDVQSFKNTTTGAVDTFDDEGKFLYSSQSPANARAQQLKAIDDANERYHLSVTREQDRQAGQHNLVKANEDRLREQTSHLTAVEGDDKASDRNWAELRDQVYRTKNEWDFNMNDREYITLAGDSVQAQRDYAEANDPSLLKPWTWFDDKPQFSDIKLGLLASQLPDNKFSVASKDKDERVEAVEYAVDYIETLEKAIPELSPKQSIDAAYLQQGLQKLGMSDEDVLATIRLRVQSGQGFSDPAQLIRNVQAYIKSQQGK